MRTDHRAMLARIKRFDQLIAYLRDEMGWPIARDSFEDMDDLFYDFTADELGIDPKTAAKIESIKRLRPLSPRQPWGIFFIKFEPRKLPVVALRRILSQVALKKRVSVNSAERAAWAADDLLFVSNYGEGDERQISFAHFSGAQDGHDLPTLKVLGWDNLDTALHLDAVAETLTRNLAWPTDETNAEVWRKDWRAAFTLRHREVVTTSRDLSIRLAALARAIRDRTKAALAIETERGPLTKLMKAFQEALVHDLDADDFADMYAQTIAYGLLSARIADPHKKTADDFAGHMRTNPFLRELMQTFLHIGGRRGKAGGPGIDFDELGVSEVVELLDDAKMEAVVRDFGDKNPQEDPVTHFYEGFAKEYDPIDKVRRGEFYTPRPVVSYIVRSVDELLRTEFGLADGLADITTWGEMASRHKDLTIPEGVPPEQAFVQILDPATGTGTFLVEVIDLIHRTVLGNWKAQGHSEKRIEVLWNEYVPRHLLPRLHAYELKMAPYAIAHLKIGLKLYGTRYRFGSEKRARVYLTNALEPASDSKKQMEFKEWGPALAHEAQAVNETKRKQRFTVVIGNPPYSLLSANMEPEQRALVEKYKYVDGARIQERGALQLEKILNDDYVKFLAKSEDSLTAAGLGIIGLITNHAYLDNPTMRGLRFSLLTSSDLGFFYELGGSAKKSGGNVDENVFDIQQGVAVCIVVKQPQRLERVVSYSRLSGDRESKYKTLGSTSAMTTTWSKLLPSPSHYLLVPTNYGLSEEYGKFVSLADAFQVHSIGCFTSKDHFVISRDPETLIQNAKAFRDSCLSDKELCKHFEINAKQAWDVSKSRKQLRQLSDAEIAKHVLRFTHRPFDSKYIFFHRSLVWSMAYPVNRNVLRGRNLAVVTSRQLATPPWAHLFCSDAVVEMFLMSNKTKEGNHVFPLWLLQDDDVRERNLGENDRQPNLHSSFLRSLATCLGLPRHQWGLPRGLTAESILGYVYSAFSSSAYRTRYAEFLKIDFPRIPLPGSLDLFRDLARLGGELVALHLMESPKLDDFITTYTGPKDPEVGRVGWSDDTVWLDAAATKKGQHAMPGTIGFRGVPEAVWNFHIGGYQVCEKWLKDRKGRTLSDDDLAHYQKIVVALNETIRLMKEIDEVIERHGGWPGAFQTGDANAVPAEVIPFRPRIVEPKPEERYVTCIPLVPLKAAAGAFSDPQHIDDDGWEWTAVDTKHRLRPGMFVAQVVGKSMEPVIPDGAYCLFAAPVAGTRQGKTVLVQLRDATDAETGERYTVKRYESEKTRDADSWRHTMITLKPVNPDFEPIVLTGADEGQLQVVAELIEVLSSNA